MIGVKDEKCQHDENYDDEIELSLGNDEFDDIENSAKYSGKSRMNKNERREKYKARLKKLNEITNGYPPIVSCKEKDGKIYYKRWYRGKRSKYLKRQSNKRIRRYKCDLPNGNQNHKLFDFWWEMY